VTPAESELTGRIERAASMLGLPPVRVAEWAARDAAENYRENAKREAARQQAIEAGEDAAWAHRHANRELGLPEDMPLAERLALLNPQGDEPTRDRRAEYGSPGNPAEFASVGGALVAVGRQAGDGAQRSSLGRARDAELLRAIKANSADPFMRSEVARFRARRKVAERALAERAGLPPAGRRESGTGWPAAELTRQTATGFRIY